MITRCGQPLRRPPAYSKQWPSSQKNRYMRRYFGCFQGPGSMSHLAVPRLSRSFRPDICVTALSDDRILLGSLDCFTEASRFRHSPDQDCWNTYLDLQSTQNHGLQPTTRGIWPIVLGTVEIQESSSELLHAIHSFVIVGCLPRTARCKSKPTQGDTEP